jgi:hypothetical protein
VAEMLVAISTLGILLAGAAVGLGTLAPQFDLDNAARKVAMALNQGRVQAITRGHTIAVTFGTNDFTITDGDETVAADQLPPHITVYAAGDAVFTSLGTLDPVLTAAIPLIVTVSNSDTYRSVSVGLIGEVQTQ